MNRQHPKHGTIHHQGFSLIELMVTLTIAGILMSIAAPSFVAMTVRNQIVTSTNAFIGSLNYARSEAIRRGQPISICSSDDATTCSGSWSEGWIIVEADSTLIAAHEGLASGYTLGSSTFTANLTFAPNGSASSTGLFAVCHDDNITGARAIIITTLRPRVGRDTDNDDIPNTDGGNIADCDP